MSVVVFRDGVLAADCKAYGGRGQVSPGWKSKLHRLPDNSRIGIVSAILGEPERFLALLNADNNPLEWKGDKPDLRALMIAPNGSLFLFEDSIWPSGPINAGEFYAIGSGSDYAMGAMAMGASAVEAVRVAIQFDPNCGGEPHTLDREG